MRVLHIFNELKFSGAEFLLNSAADIFISPNVEHVIIATGDSVGEFGVTLKDKGYIIQHIPFKKRISFFYEIAQFIRLNNVDVVHIHSERAAFFYGFISRILGKRCIRTIHNEFLFEGGLRILRAVDRRALGFLGVKFVSCSNSVKRNERARFGIDSVVIDNWFDPKRVRLRTEELRIEGRRRLGISLDAFVIISIANYGPAKNQEAIVEAMRSTSKSLKVLYIHCGSGGEQLASATGISEADPIRFVGAIANVGDYLVASDAFVSPSFFEGGPISLLEAAAAGLPCIITAVGLGELFIGQPGVEIITTSSESIAAAMNLVACAPIALQVKAGAQLSAFTLSRFTPEVGANKYMRMYDVGQTS